MADRVEILKTVKLGKHIFYKGRILVGKEIIDVVRIELSKGRGTLRKLDPSVEGSSSKEIVSKPEFIEEKKKVEKTENIAPSEKKKVQRVPKRRGRNVPK